MNAPQPMWELAEALLMARSVEQLVAPHELHIALGGGVLLKGHSYHDLDLYLYPHTTSKAPSREEVEAVLLVKGFKLQTPACLRYDDVADAKFLGCCSTPSGQRVDFFYTT